IASSQGNAMAAPRPRSMVRRVICQLLAMVYSCSLYCNAELNSSASRRVYPGGGTVSCTAGINSAARWQNASSFGEVLRAPVPKWVALGYLDYPSGKLAIVLNDGLRYLFGRRRIVELELPAQAVSQHLLHKAADKVFLARQEGRLEPLGPFDLLTTGESARGI